MFLNKREIDKYHVNDYQTLHTSYNSKHAKIKESYFVIKDLFYCISFTSGL